MPLVSSFFTGDRKTSFLRVLTIVPIFSPTILKESKTLLQPWVIEAYFSSILAVKSNLHFFSFIYFSEKQMCIILIQIVKNSWQLIEKCLPSIYITIWNTFLCFVPFLTQGEIYWFVNGKKLFTLLSFFLKFSSSSSLFWFFNLFSKLQSSFVRKLLYFLQVLSYKTLQSNLDN